MLCALMASSTWLQIANRFALPVSTTHSIVGGVLGIGVAAFGVDAVTWWPTAGADLGFGPIAISWVSSPIVSAAIAAIVFGLTRTLVLRSANSFWRAVVFAPFFYALVCSVLTLFIVQKGSGRFALDKAEEGTVALASCLAALFGGILSAVYVSWWQVRYSWRGEDIKGFEYPYFWALARRPTRAAFDTAHLSDAEKAAAAAAFAAVVPVLSAKAPAVPGGSLSSAGGEDGGAVIVAGDTGADTGAAKSTASALFARLTAVEKVNVHTHEVAAAAAGAGAGAGAGVPPVMAAAMAEAKALGYVVREMTESEKVSAEYRRICVHGTWVDRLLCPIRAFLCHGICSATGEDRDVRMHGLREHAELHAGVERFDDRTEEFFRWLQGLTSCLAAFAHGSNDVANAIGPFSVIYGVWASGEYKSKYDVDTWMLAFGGGMISLGFLVYGYHLMRGLGNSVTYHSPSRGYAMEFSAAITVLVASKLGIPVSTTQCLYGSVVAVGMMSGLKAVNWRRTANVFLSWLITVPLVATLAGAVFAFIAYSPTLRSPGA
jgi:sodium-dependent phosphate transporter